jgi:hypothetical protein
MAMAMGEILCPVCGLPLGAVTPAVKPGTDLARGAEVGRHIHMEMRGNLACANGHNWRVSGDFILERRG